MPYFRGVAAALALSLGGALVAMAQWNPPRPAEAAGLSSAAVPATVAGLVSTGDRTLAPEIRAVLPGADVISRSYGRGASAIDFLLISGAHGVALHDPRLCLGNLLLTAPETEHLPGTPVTMQVYQASSQPGAAPDLEVAYFYVAGERIVSSPSEIRSSMFVGDLLGRENAPVFFFRFMQTRSADPDSEKQRHQQWEAFATQMWLHLQPKVEAVTHEKVKDSA